MNPQGPYAASIANLWWFILIVGTLVFVAYAGMILYASWRRRHVPYPAVPGEAGPSLVVPVAGIVIPAIILVITFAYTLNTMNAIPYTAPSALVVAVVAHQWW
jgi:cytochrome c oxidase subunit 2